MESEKPHNKSVLAGLNSDVEDKQVRNDTKSDFIKLVEMRWSPRAFSGEFIDRSKVTEIFDAARHAASSYNEQPWRILLAEAESKSYSYLLQAMSEDNREWAQSASLFGAVICKQTFSSTGEENRHAEYDCGAFMALASLRALEFDLYVHQMAGFDREEVRQALHLSEGYTPITLFAMGEIGKLEDIPTKYWGKEKSGSSRKEVKEFLVWENWIENQ